VVECTVEAEAVGMVAAVAAEAGTAVAVAGTVAVAAGIIDRA